MPKFLAQAPLVMILHFQSKKASHLSFGAPKWHNTQGEKTCVLRKKLPCDQNNPKFLEIWARGSLRGTMLGHRSFNQDSKLVLLFCLFYLFCFLAQFCLQAPHLSLCTHISCHVMINHPPQYSFVSVSLLY